MIRVLRIKDEERRMDKLRRQIALIVDNKVYHISRREARRLRNRLSTILERLENKK